MLLKYVYIFKQKQQCAPTPPTLLTQTWVRVNPSQLRGEAVLWCVEDGRDVQLEAARQTLLLELGRRPLQVRQELVQVFVTQLVGLLEVKAG